MGLIQDARRAVTVGLDLIAQRTARRKVAHRLLELPPPAPHTYKIGVYFGDGAVNMYQVRQWYKPLFELSKTWPVVFLSRNSTAAATLFEESPVPVAFVQSVNHLEKMIEEQDLRIILYVNQNARNFQMMRYGRRWHVFINHGESDKMYMTTNQFKAYDYSLIAGDAARARLEKVLWDYDFDKRALPIGRPQADHYSGTLPYTPDEREVVLYAPTWEGDRPGAAYGSIASHGVALVEALLATGRHRVIYRPHPRSGVLNHAYGEANKHIMHLLEAANNTDDGAHHVVDRGAELGWQLEAADMAIVDISAMVYDRLAAGKPVLITRPSNPAAEIDEGGYLSACEWLTAADAPHVVARIDDLEHDPLAQERLDFWCRRYFGDTTAGVATAKFQAAIAHLMDEWDKNARLHEADESL
jgi:hypothetical protein